MINKSTSIFLFLITTALFFNPDTIFGDTTQTEAGFSLSDKTEFIYDFVQIVLDDMNICEGFNLNPEPRQRLKHQVSDLDFLNSVIRRIEEKKNISDSVRINNLEFQYNLSDCILKMKIADVNEMKEMKTGIGRFKWNVKKLNAKSTLETNFYNISVPLFNAERDKVLIAIDHFCGVLCGNSYILYYEKINENWMKEYYEIILH